MQADERLNLGQADIVFALALLGLEPTQLDPMTERADGYAATLSRLVAGQLLG